MPPPEETLSPKREASLKMVEMGKEYLEKKELDKAVQTFQEAVNIDYENGVAYFFLAKALYLSRSFEDALGLLERAEALLAAYPDWLEEIYRLRFLIGEGKGVEIKNKEQEKEPYY